MLLVLHACGKDPKPPAGSLQLVKATTGSVTLRAGTLTVDVPANQLFIVKVYAPVTMSSAQEAVYLSDANGETLQAGLTLSDEGREVVLVLAEPLEYLSDYTLHVSDKLAGVAGETFAGIQYPFKTLAGSLSIENVTLNGITWSPSQVMGNVEREKVEIEIAFSGALDPQSYQSFIRVTGETAFDLTLDDQHRLVTLKNQAPLKGLQRHELIVSSNLTAADGGLFKGFTAAFFTQLDSSYKFPEITDDELLDLVQRQTFKYFWDFAHPDCGLARERNSSGDIVTIGGSGFGLMALIAGIERDFIRREEGVERLHHILSFLESADRFHGVWPHWLNGKTGKTVPFSEKDDGGDLVETAFMMQGLLTFRQYLKEADPIEAALQARIDALWQAVEWDWYTQGQQVLYWHWSPNYGFNMNHQIRGHNETLITYVLAAASPTHPVSPDAYHLGYASNGGIVNGRSYFGIRLPLGWDYGRPLFFAHYSFLGLDPRTLSDRYANYWEQNVAHSLINQAWCIENRNRYIGYSAECWGLTASDNSTGYSAHSPTNDRGVITPTAALSSLPYTPEPSMRAIRHFYYLLGDKLWGSYGFYDAFDITRGWWASSYLAIDQGPIVVMIENHRSALLWNLFMSHPEVREGLTRLGFTY